MIDKVFVDSNIWCYFFLQDEKEKYKTAETFFLSKEQDTIFVISYQVINEVTNKLIQKKFDSEIIRGNIEYMHKICTIQNFSKDVILSAFHLRETYSFSFWDSIIVASALESNCTILASEDMQNNLKIDGLTIKNIFAD